MERLAFHDWKRAYSTFERTEKLRGTTPSQREWVKRAWDSIYNVPEGKHICGFPIIKNEKFYLHGFVDDINVHHIFPKGYASYVAGLDDLLVNNPKNLIPICPAHHLAKGLAVLDYMNEVVPAIHPDMEVARRGYIGKSHPTSYDFAFEDRTEMMRTGEEYWNQDWDETLLEKAEEIYYRYLGLQMKLKGEYYDPFPYRK